MSAIFEEYPNRRFGNDIAHRWWADERILVGGSVVDADDFQHLKRDANVGGTISVDNDGTGDWSFLGGAPHLHLPQPDDWAFKPIEWWWGCIAFAFEFLRTQDTVLYVHCRMGHSRSPAVAYAILRAAMGFGPKSAMARIHRGEPGYETRSIGQQNYIWSCERALELARVAGLACSRFDIRAEIGETNPERFVERFAEDLKRS